MSAQTNTVPKCTCCRTSPAGNLHDAHLGGAVCNECAVFGKIGTIKLAKALIIGCTGPINPDVKRP